MFWQHGYDGASVDTLRTAMGGISSASFYAAYGSIEQLYREALDRYLATHGRVVAPLHDDGLPPRARIERTLRTSARMRSDGEHPLGCMITLSATMGRHKARMYVKRLLPFAAQTGRRSVRRHRLRRQRYLLAMPISPEPKSENERYLEPFSPRCERQVEAGFVCRNSGTHRCLTGWCPRSTRS